MNDCTICAKPVRHATLFTPEELRADKYAASVPYIPMRGVCICILCAREITCAFAEVGKVR